MQGETTQSRVGSSGQNHKECTYLQFSLVTFLQSQGNNEVVNSEPLKYRVRSLPGPGHIRQPIKTQLHFICGSH